MHDLARLFVALPLALIAAPAAGQDGPKLNAAEIQAAFVGKTLRGRTEKYAVGNSNQPTGTRRRTDGGHVILEFVVRRDGSLIFRCTNHTSRGSTPCTNTGSDAGSRDAGLWSIENDRFCYRWLQARGGQTQCYDVYRAGDRFRWRLASGPPATLDGELVEAR